MPLFDTFVVNLLTLSWMMQSNKKNCLLMALFAIGLLLSLSLTSCLTNLLINDMKDKREIAKISDVKFNGDTGLRKKIEICGIYSNDLEFSFFLFLPDGVFDEVYLGWGRQYRFLRKSVSELADKYSSYSIRKRRWRIHSGVYKVCSDTIIANSYYDICPFFTSCPIHRWGYMKQYIFKVVDSTHLLYLGYKDYKCPDAHYPWKDPWTKWHKMNVELHFTPVDPSEMPSSKSKLKKKRWLRGENFIIEKR